MPAQTYQRATLILQAYTNKPSSPPRLQCFCEATKAAGYAELQFAPEYRLISVQLSPIIGRTDHTGFPAYFKLHRKVTSWRGAVGAVKRYIFHTQTALC